MDPWKVVKHWGSVKGAADAIGVSVQTIYQWIHTGRVPKLREYHVKALMAQKAAR